MPNASSTPTRRSSKSPSKKASSAKSSRKSSVKASKQADAEIKLEQAEIFPEWMQRRFEGSRKASQTLATKRGKSLKVFKGLDMKGI